MRDKWSSHSRGNPSPHRGGGHSHAPRGGGVKKFVYRSASDIAAAAHAKAEAAQQAAAAATQNALLDAGASAHRKYLDQAIEDAARELNALCGTGPGPCLEIPDAGAAGHVITGSFRLWVCANFLYAYGPYAPDDLSRHASKVNALATYAAGLYQLRAEVTQTHPRQHPSALAQRTLAGYAARLTRGGPLLETVFETFARAAHIGHPGIATEPLPLYKLPPLAAPEPEFALPLALAPPAGEFQANPNALLNHLAPDARQHAAAEHAAAARAHAERAAAAAASAAAAAAERADAERAAEELGRVGIAGA
jgi:hypothetical protein